MGNNVASQISQLPTIESEICKILSADIRILRKGKSASLALRKSSHFFPSYLLWFLINDITVEIISLQNSTKLLRIDTWIQIVRVLLRKKNFANQFGLSTKIELVGSKRYIFLWVDSTVICWLLTKQQV